MSKGKMVPNCAEIKIKLNQRGNIRFRQNVKRRKKRTRTNNITKGRRKKRSPSTEQEVTRLRTIRQFKQLKTQTLRFNREASSPSARMVRMRSNKRFKSGD